MYSLKKGKYAWVIYGWMKYKITQKGMQLLSFFVIFSPEVCHWYAIWYVILKESNIMKKIGHTAKICPKMVTLSCEIRDNVKNSLRIRS